MSYFYDYIRNIIIFLLFTSFLQIIMPNTKYKNYIQLVFGMILIFFMVKPAKDLFNNFRKVNFSAEYEEIFTVQSNDAIYREIHNQMVLDIFQENIKVQIEKIIGNKYKINSISIKLAEDRYYNPTIIQISLNLSRSSNSQIYVKPFSSVGENVEENNSLEENQVKKIISNFYNLNLDNIFITIT